VTVDRPEHEIRVSENRAWCETCGWSDVARDSQRAWLSARNHFERRGESIAEQRTASTWLLCEYCEWPDRVWSDERPADGPAGVTDWPRDASWAWEIGDPGKGWAFACDEHEPIADAELPTSAYKRRPPGFRGGAD